MGSPFAILVVVVELTVLLVVSGVGSGLGLGFMEHRLSVWMKAIGIQCGILLLFLLLFLFLLLLLSLLPVQSSMIIVTIITSYGFQFPFFHLGILLLDLGLFDQGPFDPLNCSSRMIAKCQCPLK